MFSDFACPVPSFILGLKPLLVDIPRRYQFPQSVFYSVMDSLYVARPLQSRHVPEAG